MTEVDRFRGFADLVGLQLEDFQLEVMEAVLSDRREVVITQPRGAGKTTHGRDPIRGVQCGARTRAW